jgi:hypothetical protein
VRFSIRGAGGIDGAPIRSIVRLAQRMVSIGMARGAIHIG